MLAEAMNKPERTIIYPKAGVVVQRIDPISTMTLDQLREAIMPMDGGPEMLARQQAVMDSATCSPCGKKSARRALCEWYRERASK